MALTDKLTAIAEAIRDKTGSTATMTLDEMPEQIAGIETGSALIDYVNYNSSSVSGYTFYRAEYLKSACCRAATSIESFAFAECANLETVELPKATTINGSAFNYCSKLTTIELPSVTTIYNYAFATCTKLTTIELPSVTTIYDYAFATCTKLTTIELPSVTTIYDYAFATCTKLTTMILSGATVCTVVNNSLDRTPIASGTGYIYVPDDLVDEYKAATNWSTYADQIKPLSELNNAND